jgi:nitroreductase/NAD-dependent dihydropyrimidine dehydrogenase PreA subunit
MINIDKTKCSSCGKCYDVCPNYVFDITESDGKQKINVKYPIQCCECGHCMAICSSNAITSNFASLEDFETLGPINIEPAELRELMFARRSIRNFKPQTVPKEIIERLLQVAVHAGTSSNGQSEAFIVIQDRQFLKELEEMVVDILWNAGIKFLSKEKGLIISFLTKKYGPEIVRQYRGYYGIIKHRRENGDLHGNNRIGGMIFRNAPVVIVVHGERGNSLSAVNSALAIRNMELLGITMGLGTCWVGFLPVAAEKDRKIERYLKLPSNRAVYGALLIGYPKHKYERKIPRKARDVHWV